MFSGLIVGKASVSECAEAYGGTLQLSAWTPPAVCVGWIKSVLNLRYQ